MNKSRVKNEATAMRQFKTIFNNIFLLGRRSNELLAEALFPFITGCVMLMKNLLTPISFIAPVIVALAINGSTRSLMIRLVEEKSGRYRETQKIMGMKQKPYFFAWYASALIRALLSGVLFLIVPMAFATRIDKDINPPPVFDDLDKYVGFWDVYYAGDATAFVCLYLVYCIAAVNQSFMLSTFFSSPKLAGEVGTFVTTITTLLVFLVYYSGFTDHTIAFVLTCLVPQACMAFGYVGSVKNPIYYQANVNMSNFDQNAAIIEMTALIFIYLGLYFYLNEVMPNEYGIAKHPLWFLKSKKQVIVNESRVKNSQLMLSEQKRSGDGLKDKLLDKDYEQQDPDVSSAIYHQPYHNPNNYQKTVEIGRLSKYFGSLKAVNNVSLNLYEKNIFCLLGHNGAGKTTMISVLTGLISKSCGSVKMYGKCLEDDLEEIRSNLGICTQRDCVYDDLTFEEQLRLIASIKGVPEDKIDQEIEEMLDKTKCQDERGKLVKALSGGNKRKLSLAMALIGGSQIVFLDEPTSGMDAISRRSIWDILEVVRNEDRTIVLTTHHLDEAEVLADRIAIMAKGKLLAVGTTDFIKENFGVGYHLNIYPDPDQPGKLQFTQEIRSQVQQIVQEYIPNSSLNSQSRKDTMSFLLPFNDKSAFGKVFHELEKIDGLMISLEMNSLEDAFINVGMDEEKFMDQEHTRLSLENARKSISNNKEEKQKFNNFDNIRKPECLSRPPEYKFVSQFTACFLRKYYSTIRTFTNYIGFIIPLVLLIGGAIVVNVMSSDLADDQKLIFYAGFLALAYSFNGGIYVMLPVQEREDNLKYALNVMGCRPHAYWLATFAFDFIIFSITIACFMTVSAIGQLTYITNHAGELILSLLMFGCCFLPFSYMWGFAFKKANSALKVFPILNLFGNYMLSFTFLGVIALLYMEEVISKGVWEGLSAPLSVFFCIVSPFYTMQWAVIMIPYVAPTPQPDGETEEDYFYVLSYKWWVYVLIMFAQVLIFSGVTFYLEQSKFSLNKNLKTADDLRQEVGNEMGVIEDDEVNNEKQRIAELANKSNIDLEGSTMGQAKDKVVVEGLWKQYENGFVAIKDVSYGVKKGEIFGLLGPNGAGKSTSFNILTSLVPRTVGSVKIKNIEVNKGIMEIYQDVGICPQFDCIWPNLNPVEHLYLFGRMKGLEGSDLDEAVQYFLQVMQLTDFVKTKAGNLSGGNKRKLCVSDALIGGPDIQFFDEPSTGVDPIARRFLWNTLQQGAALRNSAIVMTTHTMEEAESLCTKIGILINGQFYCLGSPAELRHKYGEGYTVQIKAEQQHYKEFQGRIMEAFPQTHELKDKKELFYNFRVKSKEFSFAKSFQMCEDLKERGIILDFSIQQSSLEEVFVYFSKYQKESER